MTVDNANAVAMTKSSHWKMDAFVPQQVGQLRINSITSINLRERIWVEIGLDRLENT